MSDVTIPEDVMDIARNVASAIHLKLHRAFVPEEGEAIIARAILAERERCADLAEVLPLTELSRTNDENPKIIWRVAATTQREAIAQAIRSPHE